MLSWKTLARDRVRLLLSLLGSAGAVVLILLVQGLSSGMYEQAAAFNENSGADIMVAGSGVDTMITSRSLVPLDMAPVISGVEGVDSVSALMVVPTTLDEGERKAPVLLIGYDLKAGLGRPWSIADGRRPRAGAREIVLDESLARRSGLRVGDDLELLGRRFNLVGLSRETNLWMSPYAFTSKEEAADAASMGGVASYFLVRKQDSATIAQVKKRIDLEVEGVSVITSSTMASRQREVLRGIVGSATGLMVVISYVAGFLVVGLTMYAAVIENLREYGIIKALGAGNLRLYGIIVRQSLFVALMSFALGVLLAFAARAVIGEGFPQFLILIDWAVTGKTLAAVVAISLIGATLPIRRISRLDPARVFS